MPREVAQESREPQRMDAAEPFDLDAVDDLAPVGPWIPCREKRDFMAA